MEKMINELLVEMKEGLASLTLENPAQKAHEAVEIILKVILKLKDFALGYDFKDEAEKIRLYKVYKPLFVSELYYYLKIYRLESERPELLHAQRNYLREKIRSISGWFGAHKAFCRYVRSGRNNRDADYYLPGYEDLYTALFSFDRDPAFCTAKGQDAAVLLGNKRLLTELEGRLAGLKKNRGGFFGLPKLKWTFKAIDLVELIYGLYLTGAVNNGKAELKDIAETFQQVFYVKLDNYSFTFTQSIHYRKSGSIRFLREMTDAILKKLDELDGK